MALSDAIGHESLTRRLGEEILQRTEASAPSFLSLEFGQQQAMGWMARDEDLRLRLFRFIEVLPALRSDGEIAEHFQEYMRRDEGRPLPELIRLLAGFRRSDGLWAKCVARAARLACGVMARQFVCGTNAEEAIRSIRLLRRRGMCFTLDVLGETILADHLAEANQRLYIRLIEELCPAAREWADEPVLDRASWGPIPRVNVSIKLSAIVAKFDSINPEGAIGRVGERLRPILRTAMRHGAFINVDMEHYAVKDLTLEIFKRVLMEPEFRDWADCGIVIQCYTPEGDRDISELIEWARRRGTPCAVRLVKGAYWDSEVATCVKNGWPIPLYSEKWQSDAAYERVARLMLENADAIRPAFATHNIRSMAAVLALEQALGLPPRTIEIQMLTGMGEPIKRALVEMDQRVRIYAPFGELMPGMAYLIRRLIENTSNQSFLLQTFGGQGDRVRLLMNPEASRHGAGAALPRPVAVDLEESVDMEPFTNEADVDFSREANRCAMREALERARARFGREAPALIDGEPVVSGRWRESRNPSNPREVVGKTAVSDRGMVDRAVTAARGALEGWAAMSPGDRAAILCRAADRLHAARYEAAALVVFEVGKNWREAHGDVMEAIDYLRFYAAEIRRLLGGTRRREYPGESSEYVYQQRGVAAVISPFCFPMALLTGMTAAALATGNTVVVKPAEEAALCGAFVADLLNEAGLPRGALNFLPGSGEEVGAALVEHEGVDLIAFTGSAEVGGGIIEAAGRRKEGRGRFKHVVADMGGKNAIIVDDDADLDDAVKSVIESAFAYSGQKCTSCSRAIVLEGAYEAFVRKLVDASRGISPGAAELPGTSIGPMIDEEAVRRVRRYVEIGKGEAKCVLEGRATGGAAKGGGAKGTAGSVDDGAGGWFVGPVIFADVPSEAVIAQEEILGPVLAVMRARSFEEAIDLANGTRYALTAGVFSRRPSRIEMAKRRLEAGVIYVNRKTTVSRVDRQPFGGFKMSGLGSKTGGPDYLREFVVARTISENTMRHGFAPGTGEGKRGAEKSGTESREAVGS